MEAFEYIAMATAQRRHWWFRGKRRIVAAMIERFAGRTQGIRSLEVGCGTGANLELLASHGESHGVDVEPLALALARRAGAPNLACARAGALPFPDATFEVVALLDVLYHRRVDDLDRALAEARRVCRPSGIVVITDSAFEFLRGPHDVVVHAARRFRRGEIVAAVERAGLEVVRASYANALLFPLALGVRLAARWRTTERPTASDLAVPPRPVNALLAAIYGLEARLLTRVSLPIGLSVLVVGRRPGRTR
jgi:SAM-dependent methyltransferase